MLVFIKKVFWIIIFYWIIIFIKFSKYTTSLNCECKLRPKIINVNSNEPVFYPFSIKTIKCRGSCNNIKDPYANICVPDFIKDLNVKVLFNLMSRTNEARHIK